MNDWTMTEAELMGKLTELEQREKSNQHRIDELEQSGELLHRMVTSLEVLATRQENMSEKVERIDSKVTKLEEEPTRRWQDMLRYGIASLVSAGVTYLGTVWLG